MSTPHYTYSVSWSPEDAEFVGTVVEFPSLSWLGPVEGDAFEGIRSLVEEVVADMLARDEAIPEAIADRAYSGKFQVRTTPARHRELALEAARSRVSMNRLINDKLSA